MKQVGYPSTVYVLSTLISFVDRQNRSITRLLEHWDFQDLALLFYVYQNNLNFENNKKGKHSN